MLSLPFPVLALFPSGLLFIARSGPASTRSMISTGFLLTCLAGPGFAPSAPAQESTALAAEAVFHYADLDRAVRFYRDNLGLVPVETRDDAVVLEIAPGAFLTLATLESAIRKIDRETRSRFKETFDLVNGGLQELFPRVFGGGSASLEMTGEDLLDTGVSILARPPGKKNSTIHLLSGGEKALTAIALVFSIFQLNPAPFCMLDEVDAPLDDANVGRYARMVREMSEKVQFVFITHNKITMEMADHLMGVTMHEPGVSRLVSVDVDEAAELAAS